MTFEQIAILAVLIAIPMLVVAGLTWLAGRAVIPFLVRAKLNDGEQRKASDYLNMLHSDKKNTPTMGGVFLVPVVLISAIGLILFIGETWNKSGLKDETLYAVGLLALVVVVHAALGLIDDYCKLKKLGKDGLPGKVKLVVQTSVSLLACAGAALLVGPENRVLVLPYFTLDIGWLMVPFGAFVMVGASNAYNLTDGLDGLAGGTGFIAFLAMALCLVVMLFSGLHIPGFGMEGLIFSLCAAGGLLGFLAWNRHPAKVFMGDTGSLSLGAMIGFIAVLTRLEFVLAIAGAVFVAEAGSVMLQVGYFKATKGKRIFRCAPLHHHFQFGGMHESKVTRRFWMAGVLFAVASVASVPLLKVEDVDTSIQMVESEMTRVIDEVVVEK
ncbi:MAG: phospho-N-acetylmuramoyl-pentapeptide-transferase [Planctomycetota bacterium]|jgi:phospho-N-acetylmuramoyl-pentapeptide-transferase